MENEVLEKADIENFIVNYSDGTQKVVDKGFFCEITEEDEEAHLEFFMAHCSGRDLETIILGCVHLGAKLGMFENKKERK